MSHLPQTCSDLHEIIGAYSIGATTPAENRAIEALLPACPEAAAELTDYLAVRESILQLAAQETPVAPGRELLAALPLDDSLRQYPEEKATPSSKGVQPVAHHRRHEETVDRLRPLPPHTADTRTRAFPVAVWYAFGSVAAALVLVVGLLAIMNNMLTEMRAERETLLALVENAASRPAEPAITVNAGGARVDGITHVHLTPAVDEAPNGMADVIWDPATGFGTLTVHGLPPLPEGTRYQMWLVREGEEHGVGQFAVDENGTGALVFMPAEPLTDFSVIGISMEPDAGSDVPTTPHMITGQIGA